MKTIEVPTRDQVSADSQVLFDQIQKKFGKVPNLLAALGYSPKALQAYLQLDSQFAGGAFTAKEREAVALAVSQVNSCDYCLASHTLSVKAQGFGTDDTLAIRRGDIADPKLQAVVQLAQAITVDRGHVDSALVDAFFSFGYNEGALMELIGLVTARIFTNYVYALTDVPVDFPTAPVLEDSIVH